MLSLIIFALKSIAMMVILSLLLALIVGLLFASGWVFICCVTYAIKVVIIVSYFSIDAFVCWICQKFDSIKKRVWSDDLG